MRPGQPHRRQPPALVRRDGERVSPGTHAPALVLRVHVRHQTLLPEQRRGDEFAEGDVPRLEMRGRRGAPPPSRFRRSGDPGARRARTNSTRFTPLPRHSALPPPSGSVGTITSALANTLARPLDEKTPLATSPGDDDGVARLATTRSSRVANSRRSASDTFETGNSSVAQKRGRSRRLRLLDGVHHRVVLPLSSARSVASDSAVAVAARASPRDEAPRPRRTPHPS